MSLPNEQFGAAVREVLEEHGLTFRGQRMRTGLNHVTVSNMAKGIVPSMETVIAFAHGFSLDVNEWLERAGYEPIQSPASGQAEQERDVVLYVLRRYAQLQRQFPNRSISLPDPDDGLLNLTLEEAESIMDDIESDLRADAGKGSRSEGEG